MVCGEERCLTAGRKCTFAFARTSFQAVQPLCGIGNEAWLAHFTVVDDIDSELNLLPYTIADSLLHSRRVGFIIDWLAVHSRQHHVEQIVRAWQAADMRGEDTVSAQFHCSFPFSGGAAQQRLDRRR